MLKKFTEGLVFGGGFALSFVVVWYVASYFVYPLIFESQMKHATSEITQGAIYERPSGLASIEESIKSSVQFHDLSLEEQIKESTLIALARYEASTDGKMKAVIKEILKKNEGVTFYYNVGDEYPSSSYYPKDNTSYGDGVVIFFTGSPAVMKMSMTYSGDRIRGLGDLPLELLRKKCEEPNA